MNGNHFMERSGANSPFCRNIRTLHDVPETALASYRLRKAEAIVSSAQGKGHCRGRGS
jgi:hypothetical protein